MVGTGLAVTGNTVQAVVSMSYPLFDLLLIVLLVAGLAPLGFRPTLQARLLLIGVTCFEGLEAWPARRGAMAR